MSKLDIENSTRIDFFGDYGVYLFSGKYCVVDENNYEIVKNFSDPYDALELAGKLDNYDVKIHTVRPGEVYHLTYKDLGTEILLDPKYSIQHYDMGKAICFAPSISRCLAGLPASPVRGTWKPPEKNYVYTPKEETKVYTPMVEDSDVKEVRSVFPVKVEKVGRVLRSKEPTRSKQRSFKYRAKWIEGEQAPSGYFTDEDF